MHDRLSIVLSFRNEEAVIPELLRRLTAVIDALGMPAELVFVNDASNDRSLALLADAAARDRRIKVITMSRRFGPSECAMAGLAHASGDACVLMDADLQDPPEVIPTLVQRWREGADVVYTVRTARHGEPPLKSLGTRLAYRVIRAAGQIDLPVEAGDFRLLNRRVVNTLLSLPERNPYLRGLVAWVGFTQVAVPYERQPRFAGPTHFPWFGSWNPWRTFLSGVTSFSTVPLLVFLPAGVLVFAASLAAIVALLVAADWQAPTTLPLTIAAALAALVGLQLAGIGVLGLYVAQIHDDVRGRPLYVIDHIIGE